MMEYKGYVGRVEYDDEAGIFHGEVINTRDVITFQGSTVAELRKAFRESVEDYLAFCDQRGEQPDKPFSGQFITRISPDLHRRINIAATLSGKSLNTWVADQLEKAAQNTDLEKKAFQKKRELISARNTKDLWKKALERVGIPTEWSAHDLVKRFIVHCSEDTGKEVADRMQQALGEDIFKEKQIALQEGGGRWPLRKREMREALPGEKVYLLYVEKRDSRDRFSGWSCVTLPACEKEAEKKEFRAVIFSAD